MSESVIQQVNIYSYTAIQSLWAPQNCKDSHHLGRMLRCSLDGMIRLFQRWACLVTNCAVLSWHIMAQMEQILKYLATDIDLTFPWFYQWSHHLLPIGQPGFGVISDNFTLHFIKLASQPQITRQPYAVSSIDCVIPATHNEAEVRLIWIPAHSQKRQSEAYLCARQPHRGLDLVSGQMLTLDGLLFPSDVCPFFMFTTG